MKIKLASKLASKLALLCKSKYQIAAAIYLEEKSAVVWTFNYKSTLS